MTRLLVLFLMCIAAAAHAVDPSAREEAVMKARVEEMATKVDAQVQARQVTDVQRTGVRPNVDALPTPASSVPPVDIEALAGRLTPEGAKAHAEANKRPILYAFVSTSMPEASLNRLAADAGALRATVVLRGFVADDLRTTQRTVARIFSVHKARTVLDPVAFQRFNVSSVPTYVLVRAGAVPKACDAEQCFGDQDYVRIVGDVPLRYALDRIATMAPEFAPDVAAFTRGRP